VEQLKKTAGASADSLCVAEVMAYQGRYQEAAKMFIKAGSVEKCVRCSAVVCICVWGVMPN
jgi:hypothetical protein